MIPKLLEIGREDWVFGKAVGKTTEHVGRRAESECGKWNTV